MAYNESLATRVKQILTAKKIKHTEKKMFGGVCFLVDDKMLIGVEKERIMARIDPEDEAKALKKKGAKPMDFTGRVMKGFLFVDDKAVDKDAELEYWVDLTMKYNPKAKASKKKAKAKAEAEAKDNKVSSTVSSLKTTVTNKAKANVKAKAKAEAKDKIATKKAASTRKSSATKKSMISKKTSLLKNPTKAKTKWTV